MVVEIKAKFAFGYHAYRDDVAVVIDWRIDVDDRTSADRSDTSA